MDSVTECMYLSLDLFPVPMRHIMCVCGCSCSFPHAAAADAAGADGEASADASAPSALSLPAGRESPTGYLVPGTFNTTTSATLCKSSSPS